MSKSQTCCGMLAKAGVKRCYGIVGDALNPVVDALRRNGAIELFPFVIWGVRSGRGGLFQG
jgi:thiamine pyrophosphate-dependent acetolactate synthase large subunit-like protein